MSRLNELIRELCPDGVEYKTLDEVAIYSKSRITADMVDSKHYVGVDNLLPNKAGKKDSDYVPITGSLIEFVKGDILIGNIRPYLKKIWLATDNGGTNGDVLVVRSIDKQKFSPEYLFYVLSSDDFFSLRCTKFKGCQDASWG